MIANFHTHANFCDGVGSLNEYVEAALKCGMKYLGFSCHAPIPLTNGWTMRAERATEYLKAVSELKREYKKQIEIYTGMEIDYFEGDTRNVFQRYPLDYTIGAVHFFADVVNDLEYPIDGSIADFEDSVETLCNGNVRLFVQKYYETLYEMVKTQKPTILAHLDVIKKNNGDDGRYFNEKESWYREAVLKLLDIVKTNGTIVEINTGGITRHFCKEVYPSGWILKECRQREIPIVITTDAHRPELLDSAYNHGLEAAREAGYTQQMILHNGKWEQVDL